MGDLSVDYWALEPPEDKDPPDYSYQERRADILHNYLLNHKHPEDVNWSELARYYEKSKSTIHNDKTTLLDYLIEEFDARRIKQLGLSLFEAGYREVVADEDYGPFDEINFYNRWIETLDKLGFLDLGDEDAEDLFLSEDGEGGVTVEIAGVAASDVEDDLPEQDRPEEEAEVVET